VWTNLNGIEWSPVSDLTIRSQFQRAVRAPSIGELFGGQSGDRPRAVDPCALASAATNATIRAVCIATGVPEALVGQASVQPDVRIDGILGGNPNLSVEKSDTKTFGFTYAPHFVPGLKLSVDRFDISVDGAIAPFGFTLQTILNLCYTTVQDANSAVCGAIHRNPTNGVIASPFVVNEANANIGRLATKGIDLAVDYRFGLPFGVVGSSSTVFVASRATWTENFDITPLQDLPSQVNHCVGAFGTTCREPRPEYKTATRINWVSGPLTLSLNHRYLSKLTDDRILIPRRQGLTTGPSEASLAVPNLAAKQYVDLSFNYDLQNRNISINGGVNNILNTKPPIVGSAQQQANTYPSTYDVLGPEVFLGVRARF
jgi:outer membrane receptor protein involved in Fe transport